MSAISLKSITGITSITTPAGVDNQLTLHTNNTTERFRIDSTGKATFSGDVQIDGDELFIADSIKHVGDTDTLISFPSNDTINFRTAGTERLRIDSAGNMSLGKGASASTSYTTQFQIHSSNTSGAALHLTNSTSGSGNGDGFHLVQQSHIYHWLREDAHQIFATNGAERLRITSNGKIFINHTSDSNATSVFRGLTDNTHPVIKVRGTQVNGYTLLGDEYTTDESQFTMGVAYSSASFVLGWGVKVGTDANNKYLSTQDTYSTKHSAFKYDGNGLKFLTNTSSQTVATDSEVTLTERLRITPDGDVVIGSFTPVDTRNTGGIHIQPNKGISFRAYANFAASRNWRIRNDDTAFGNLDFSVGDNNSTDIGSGVADAVLSLTKDHYVGINNAAPDQRLKISGNIETNAYDNAGGSGGYYTSKGLIIGNAYDAGKTGLTDDRNSIIWSERGLDLDFATNDTFRMKLSHDGRIGIGTAIMDSSAEVSIVNASSSARVYMKSGNSADCSIYFGSMNDAATGAIRYDHSDDSLRFYGYNNSEKVRITTDKVMFSADAKVDANNTRDLGASGSKWKTLYLGTQLNITGQGASNATPRLLIKDGTGGDNDFSISQYEDSNGTYTLIGQNVQLNGSGSEVIQDSNHKTASIYLDARNNGAIMFNTGGTNAHHERLRIKYDGEIQLTNSTIRYENTGGSFNQVRHLSFPIYFSSGTTHNVLTIGGSLDSGFVAFAVLEYIGLYGYAGQEMSGGVKRAFTRRRNNNTSWRDFNDQVSENIGENRRPTLFWDNGVLKVTVGGSVQITGYITVTAHAINQSNFTLTRN